MQVTITYIPIDLLRVAHENVYVVTVLNQVGTRLKFSRTSGPQPSHSAFKHLSKIIFAILCRYSKDVNAIIIYMYT